MALLRSCRIALKALGVNKLRTALTMLGIIIGVSAVIATMSVGAGAQAKVTEQLRRLGSNILVIRPGSVSSGGVRLGAGTKPAITEDDATAIAHEVPAVEAAAPSVWPGDCCQVIHGNMNWWTGAQGTTPDFEKVRQWPVTAGRYFTEDEVAAADKVVVLGQTVATNLFGARNPLGQMVRVGSRNSVIVADKVLLPGQSVAADPPASGNASGQVVSVSQVPLTVVGVLARKGPNARGQDEDDLILLPITTTTRRVIGPLWTKHGAVHAITVKLRDGADLVPAERQIRRLLRQRHQLQPFQDDDFRVRNPTAMLEAEEESTRILTILLGAIASVSLLVGGIGIMNIMLVSVTERSREIGIRMAVGARRTDILTQFLVEALTLALIGGLAGVCVGVLGSHAISYLAEWRTLVRIDAILLAFAFAAGVGIFFGFYPARKASLLNPIEALRYE
jgi:putative ABC transport system permease protein